MAKILIYDLKTEGHHIEYLHHLYVGAISSFRPDTSSSPSFRPDTSSSPSFRPDTSSSPSFRPDTSSSPSFRPERSGVEKSPSNNECVFVVGKDFTTRSADFQWDKSENIRFIYLENEEGEGGILKKSWRMNRQLRKVVKAEKPDKIFLNTLMNFMPFLPCSVGKSKVSGIIYSIYLHDLASASVFGKLSNKLKYRLLSRNKSIENIFILNDKDSVEKLNEIWKTDKFKYLTDPYIPFENASIHNLRGELGIAEDKQIIAHIGYLEERKGTLEVLDMIGKTPIEDRKKYCIIFAGRIDDDIKNEFFKKVELLKDSIQIVTKIGFMLYDFMGSLVFTADKVVLPYKIVNASSGIIGYCAQFKTPVYVPAKGLIGKLVEDYNIGVAVDKFNSINDLQDIDINGCNYCESHTVEAFIDDIFKKLS